MSPSVWISKNLRYETPYCVTGTIKLTGSEQAPKDIYGKIELSERGKVLGIEICLLTKNNKQLN